MKLEWLDEMSTGVKEVDDAHKVLILWINKLNSEMKSGNGRKEIYHVLDFLEKYAAVHFAHEENCMLQLHCAGAAANKKAHEEFQSYFVKMREKMEIDGVTIKSVIEISAALGDWLKNHIMKIDTKLLPCAHDVNTPSEDYVMIQTPEQKN